jgi:uncharacterized membrane protein
MNMSSRLPAVLVYLLPVLGWLYVFFFQRRNSLALYHLRQAIGLVVFLIVTLIAWAVVGWLLAWIPYFAVLSIALFALVVSAYVYGIVAWLVGIYNALSDRESPLPLFGRWASRLPIQ